PPLLRSSASCRVYGSGGSCVSVLHVPTVNSGHVNTCELWHRAPRNARGRKIRFAIRGSLSFPFFFDVSSIVGVGARSVRRRDSIAEGAGVSKRSFAVMAVALGGRGYKMREALPARPCGGSSHNRTRCATAISLSSAHRAGRWPSTRCHCGLPDRDRDLTPSPF